jgi:hypothetical protein
MGTADWQIAVTVRYAVRPTLDAMGREVALRGWSIDMPRGPGTISGRGPGPVTCTLSIPNPLGTCEVTGVGVTAEEALGRAMVAAPRDPPAPGRGAPAPRWS